MLVRAWTMAMFTIFTFYFSVEFCTVCGIASILIAQRRRNLERICALFPSIVSIRSKSENLQILRYRDSSEVHSYNQNKLGLKYLHVADWDVNWLGSKIWTAPLLKLNVNHLSIQWNKKSLHNHDAVIPSPKNSTLLVLLFSVIYLRTIFVNPDCLTEITFEITIRNDRKWYLMASL